MNQVVFRCPQTGMNVQHRLTEGVPQDDPQSSYETVVCQACSRIHFINRANGKLLGEQHPRQQP